MSPSEAGTNTPQLNHGSARMAIAASLTATPPDLTSLSAVAPLHRPPLVLCMLALEGPKCVSLEISGKCCLQLTDKQVLLGHEKTSSEAHRESTLAGHFVEVETNTAPASQYEKENALQVLAWSGLEAQQVSE